MINLRKTMVLFAIGVMTISLVLVPFAPMTKVDSQVAAPTDYEREFAERWASRLQQNPVTERVDPLLVSYMETGALDEKMVTTRSGDVKLLLYLEPAFDTDTLAGIAKVRWQIDFKLMRIASVEVSSVKELRQLKALNGITYLQADIFIDPEPSYEDGDDISPDMFHINDVVGATQANALGYTGDGVIVGIDDTGIDFSQSDMWNTEYHNTTHPMSYDPSSYGLTEMVIANNTYVENTTAWLEAGYLLTYELGGNYYLNVTGWDPVCNNGNTHRYLMGLLAPYGNGYPPGPNIGFIGLYQNAWGIDNASEFVYNEMWKDWQIPAPGAHNYTFGWAQQQRNAGYMKVFAASMIYEGDLIIDWNGSLAWTEMWMGAMYYEYYDLNSTADRTTITGMMDWSFVDDYDLGFIYNAADNVLYADGLIGGSLAMGLGSLSWAYDEVGYLSFDPGLFCAITDDGMAWNALYPGGTTTESNHGHWTGAAIASQGVYGHNVYGNGTLYNLPGVAPGARLIATKGITSGGGIMSDFWAAGFHLNETSGSWEYIGDGPSHRADIVSNSWGWGPGGSYLQLYYYALMYDMASVPNVLGTGYPGTLFVFSAGNNGNDYGTSGTPAGSYSVVSVGASYTSHYYETSYGPEQTDGQAVEFSSAGPAFTGVVKPDIMAPGYRGVSPQPSQNEWWGAGATYYWWQGTSLSCPLVAGVAAIIIDAYVTVHAVKPTPQMLRNILLSSATDMGYDPFIQGHGLVNALAAVTAIDAQTLTEYIFESEGFGNYGAQVAEAWSVYGYNDDPFGIYMPSPTPVGMESSSIFFGSVERGETEFADLTAWDYALNEVQTGAFDTVTAWQYTQGSKFSFGLTTGQYNDTNFSPVIVRPKSFNLYDYMDAGQEAAFLAAKYVTINVAFGAGDIPIYARLFDWNDLILPGELNYWNFTSGVGDIVDHVSRYTSTCNLLTLRLADPATMASLFDYVPALQLEDTTAPTTVTVTITIWQTTVEDDIVIADGVPEGINVTLNVNAAAEYGIHQGSILFVDGAWSHMVPYSYMVDFNMASLYGTNQTIVNGAGTVTPYDTGAVTTSFIRGSTRTDESGGIDVFRVNIPYDITLNASVLVIRAEWQNPGTVVDFQLRDLWNGLITTTNDRPSSTSAFNPVPFDDLYNMIIWDNEGGLINGSYWLLLYTHVFNGTSVPEDIKVILQLYNATTFADLAYDNKWTSRTMTTPTPYYNGNNIVGDHVVITNTWSVPTIPGVPEYALASTKTTLLSGLYVEMTGSYANPGGVDDWPISVSLTNLYTWETVEGINAGDVVRVVLDAQNGADPSFDVWTWDDENDDGEVSLDEIGDASLLSVDNGGGGGVESGQYTAADTGAIAIRVFCWDYSFAGQNYKLTVDTRASAISLSEAGTPAYTEYDTYLMLRNVTVAVIFTCYTTTNLVHVVQFPGVTFSNYFKPHVTVGVPSETTADHFNLTWSSTDQNADDVAYYSIWLSRDGGATYALLLQNTTGTFYVWDSTTWVEANYTLRVRAYSCDFSLGLCDVSENPPTGYWPADFTDAFTAPFAAGGIPPPVTTTTTTTTTPPTTGPVTPIDPLLIGLVAGIGVGVVVVLILFLIKKR